MPGCRAFTQEEEDKIISSFTGRFALRNIALFTLGTRSGFRISELLSLKLGQVLERGRVARYVTVPRRAMKGGRSRGKQSATLRLVMALVQAFGVRVDFEDEQAWKRFELLLSAKRPRRVTSRTVRLHAEAAERLEAWIRQMRELGYMTADCYVFQSGTLRNRPISRGRAYEIVLAACRRARISTARVGTHSMRKTFAARLRRRLGPDLRKLQEAMGHVSLTSTAQYVEVDREEIERAIENA